MRSHQCLQHRPCTSTEPAALLCCCHQPLLAALPGPARMANTVVKSLNTDACSHVDSVHGQTHMPSFDSAIVRGFLPECNRGSATRAAWGSATFIDLTPHEVVRAIGQPVMATVASTTLQSPCTCTHNLLAQVRVCESAGTHRAWICHVHHHQTAGRGTAGVHTRNPRGCRLRPVTRYICRSMCAAV